MESKELIAFLKTQGHPVRSHMSTISFTVAHILRDRKPPSVEPKQATTTSSLSKGDANGSGKSPSSEKQTTSRTNSWERDGSRPSATASSGDSASTAKRGKGRVKRFFPTNEYSGGHGGTRYGNRKSRGGRPGGGAAPRAPKTEFKPPEKIEVSPPVTLKDLSSALGMKVPMLMKKLFDLGKRATQNQFLDSEFVEEICMEIGTEVEFRKKDDGVDEVLKRFEKYESQEENLVSRAPVVTFLGHVDHGKTSLLDKIRETSVQAREHGGITQHLGAYRVDKDNAHVTFIDTPGHKAFTEMRARGANVTDVAVLIVAADDGPMPQTEEAINHARAAKVPILVAINKIDLPGANPQRCKEQLSGLGLQPVEWSGDTEVIEVSAQTGEGIETLLETLSLESEILELKADPTRDALGVVLDAEATKHRGVLATVLIQDGTLRQGDYVMAGASHGRVRDILVNGNEQVDAAGPSMPVTIVGLNIAPDAGEKFYVFENEKQARQLAEERERGRRELEQAAKFAVKRASLQDLVNRMGDTEVKELKLILKADVRGSIEALRSSIESLSTEEVQVVVLHTGVGAITQEDVHLASASEAVIVGFHVVADDRARGVAEEQGVDIRHYKVIYEAVEDIRAAMESRLAPEETEVVHGRAQIRQIFRASKIGNIAGCMVTSGFILRSDRVRLIRDGTVIYTGNLTTLKRFKDDAKEVKEGFECGIKIANYEDIKEGDEIESFTIKHTARTLSS